MAKEIPLTRGLVALVDDDDFEWLNQWKWCSSGSGNHIRAMRGLRETHPDGTRRKSTVLMHRQIMQPRQGYEVDHIDGNPLNNTRTNLRVCTHAENARNKRLSAVNSSGYKGVCKETRFPNVPNPWKASIKVGQKFHHIGSFPTAEAAARAYNEAAVRLHGEFASLNTIRTSGSNGE